MDGLWQSWSLLGTKWWLKKEAQDDSYKVPLPGGCYSNACVGGMWLHYMGPAEEMVGTADPTGLHVSVKGLCRAWQLEHGTSGGTVVRMW